MKGLPPQTLPLRVVVQGDATLLDALSAAAQGMILSPVETSLDISARVTQADVLVVDAPQASSLEPIRALTFARPVLALVEPALVQEALAAGAAGAIPRSSSPQAVAAAISTVRHGLTVVDRRFVDVALGAAASTPTDAKPSEVLTNREREVLGLLADGLSNKEIAGRLEISEHTAKFHVNSILQKMGAQKRVEAVVRAARLGIIEL